MANVEGKATAITVLTPLKREGPLLLWFVFWAGRNIKETLKKLETAEPGAQRFEVRLSSAGCCSPAISTSSAATGCFPRRLPRRVPAGNGCAC